MLRVRSQISFASAAETAVKNLSARRSEQLLEIHNSRFIPSDSPDKVDRLILSQTAKHFPNGEGLPKLRTEPEGDNAKATQAFVRDLAENPDKPIPKQLPDEVSATTIEALRRLPKKLLEQIFPKNN